MDDFNISVIVQALNGLEKEVRSSTINCALIRFASELGALREEYRVAHGHDINLREVGVIL